MNTDRQFTRRFKWSDQSDLGEGWVPAWMEDADPVQGFGAAHDCLEHFLDCIGGFEGELMAFGAMHRVRGMNSGYDWRLSTVYAAQASDLQYFMEKLVYGDQTLKSPTPEALAKIEQYEGDYAFDTGEMRIHIRKAILDLCEAMEDLALGGRTRAEVRRTLPRDATDRILGWMLLGYEKAQLRFEPISDWAASELFRETQSLFDTLLSRVDGENYDEIELSFDINEGTVSGRVIHPKDEYTPEEESEYA